MFITMGFEVRRDPSGDLDHVEPVKLEYACENEEEAFLESLAYRMMGVIGRETALAVLEATENPPFAAWVRGWPLARAVRVSATGQG